MNLTLLRFFSNEFRKRRKKAALITFALFWGSLSILLLLAFGKGMSAQFRISFSGLGQDLIMISGGQTSKLYQGLPKGRRIRLYPGDIQYLKERIPEISLIAPESYNNWPVSANRKEINRTIHGTTSEFALMRTQIPKMGGRFINASDVKNGRKVAFIGWKVGTDLFGTENPVGQKIVINRIPFTVIGVLKKKLQDSMYQGPDADQIYLPYSAFTQIDSQLHIDRIHIQPHETLLSPLVEERVETLLGKKYRFDPTDRYALNIWNTIDNAKEAGAIFMGIEVFLGIMGALTLLIGAVGVTNLMYAVIKERKQEIGIKMALGAKRRVIIQQFILETLFIFVKGTFWGLVTAFNIIHLVRLVPINYEGFGIEGYLLRPVFSFETFIIFLVIVGTLVFMSGIFPAVRASRLNPIDSLRYE
jgi:putative ABC transport system permease protein